MAKGTSQQSPVVTVPWRDSGEAVYVLTQNDPAQPQNYDRVCVVYSVDFPDETDRAMCRILLQQFAEQHRKIGAAPTCTTTSRPPRRTSTCACAAKLGAGSRC